MSRQVSSPSPDTPFSLTWSRLFPPAMVRGTATEPIPLDDTPSPRQSPEPPKPPEQHNSSTSKTFIVIEDSDNDDNEDDPSSTTRPASGPRLASRGSAHPWKSSVRGRETPPQTDPLKVERTKSNLNSPVNSIKRPQKLSPKAAANVRQMADPTQRQASRNSSTPSRQFSASRTRVTPSPLAPPEHSPQRRNIRKPSPSIHEKSSKGSPPLVPAAVVQATESTHRRVSSRSRTPSQKVQTPRTAKDMSPLAVHEVSATRAAPSPRSNSPIDEDVVMQDEVIGEEQVVQRDTVIEQEEKDQEDEIMKDMTAELGNVEDMDINDSNHEATVESTIGTESPLLERIRQRRLRGTASDAQVGEVSFEKSTLEYHLKQFEVSMEEDHTTTVRWLLHDARRASTSLSRFADEESPFTSATSVLWEPGTLVPVGCTKVKVESHVSRL